MALPGMILLFWRRSNSRIWNWNADSVQRLFRYDCYEIAKYNPAYLTSVEAERQRLGENHPLFRTQYLLLPVQGGGGFLNCQQRAQLQGTHSRRHHPLTQNSVLITHDSKIYVASIDLGGEAEAGEDDYLKDLKPRHDSTVITTAELTTLMTYNSKLTTIKIVEHYVWTGVRHTDLYRQMVDILKNVRHCRSVVVDATGLGHPVASFLRQALGSRVVHFDFTAPSNGTDRIQW